MLKNRGLFGLFILVIVFLTLILGSFTYVSAQIPSPTNKYVNDFAGLFTGAEVNSLQSSLAELEQNTTAELVVVTIEDCGGDYNGYAYNLATSWKIGKKDKSNGFLILYCKTEKRLVAQTGYGLEGILPDSKIGRLMDEFYVPLRDNNQTTSGIIAFTNQISQVIHENAAEVISGQAASSGGPDFITIIIWVFFIYVIFSKILGAIYKDKKRKDWPWFIPIFLPFPSGNSRSGFGGSGFGGGFSGGFGGGGFGGGGVSR